MERRKKVIRKRLSKKDKEKIRGLAKKGFVFTGKSRVCGHCDLACTD